MRLSARRALSLLSQAVGPFTRQPVGGRVGPLSDSHAVLLLGWGGATDRALVKYAQLYDAHGLETTRFIPRVLLASRDGRLHGMREMSLLHASLDRLLASRRRLILHTFSMNGPLALSALLLSDKYKTLLQRVDGILFDSGPVHDLLVPYYYGGINMVREASEKLSSPLAKAALVASCLGLFPTIIFHALRIRALLATGRAREHDVNACVYLRDHPDLPRHQAFLYSDADQCCPASSVALYHDHVSSVRGCSIISRRFSDSPHTSHLLAHPDEYRRVLDQLLEAIANTKGKESSFPTNRTLIGPNRSPVL